MNMVDDKGNSRNFVDGKFSVLKFMKNLSDYETSEYAQNPEAIARQHILSNLQRAGGTNGSQGMELLATPSAFAMLNSIKDTIDKGADTAIVQGTFADQSVLQQFNNAKTNVTTLMSELGTTLLPTVSAGLKEVNSGLTQLIDTVRRHPVRTETGMVAAGGLATILGAGAMLNISKFALKGFGFFKEIQPVLKAASDAEGTIEAAGGGLLLASKLLKIGGILGAVYGVGKVAESIYDHSDFFKNAYQNPEGLHWHQGDGRNAFERFLHSGLQADPAPKGQQTTVNTTVNLDGRTIANVVTQHQSNQLNRSTTNSGSGYDPRMSPMPSGN
jgi:hypothetical protein